MHQTSRPIAFATAESRWSFVAFKTVMKAARRWRTSVSFALLDQGTTGITNFLLMIIAARSLPINEFGHYVNVCALSWLIVPAVTALASDPLPAIVSARRTKM